MPHEIHGVGPTPVTRPLHLACLACEPAEVFYTLRQLVEHLLREHPRSMRSAA
jgi:hypothetical protein